MVSRGAGRSAVAASAYLSCSRMLNDYDGVQHDYTRKQGLAWQAVFLPPMAPPEWQDREKLWNAVEEAEKTKDSRLAREFVAALPIELSRQQQIELLQEFIRKQFVDEGMCADVAIHDTDGHNPHAHILLTVRPLDEHGKWQYKTEKEYLCVKDGEERGFTASEFKAAQAEGWEKQYPYKVGKKKVYMASSVAQVHGYVRMDKHPKSTRYEAYLDVDPQVIREAIENPDQSHVDEMLAFAEQANREYEAELYGQQAAPTPDDRETGETVRTPRGTFHVTDMSREQMAAAGYGFHHESEDGKYLIMANGSRAFAIPSGAAPEHTAPEKLTVLVVEPMKEPYVKEIDPGLHALQAEVGGDIAASYPFDDPVGLVLNDEGKLIGLDLNRSLRDEHGEIYDIVAGTFLVVALGPESFASLPPDMIQKYTEQFKRPELFASINGQIVSVPVEPENPLRTAEMTLEDDYGMIDGIINNGCRGEELEKAQAEAHRTTPEKKPSIRERLEDAKRECAERKAPDKPAPQKTPPELGDL